MRIVYWIICLGFLVTGCSDWLDVKPRSENREDEHYAYEEGFKSTLLGVYIRMASETLYGRDMTMVLPELLSQHWVTNKNSSFTDLKKYYNIATFQYGETDVEDMLKGLWKEYYLAIANLNSMLENIEEQKHIFSSGNYELIKGEALGLRAFLHFDLLRLFGPVPDKNSGEKIAIPYVKHVTKTVEDLLSLSQDKVIESALADLDSAEILLQNDPLVEYDNAFLNKPGALNVTGIDEFYYYRQYRFNLYAVKATKARVFLWKGDYQNAGKYAREVIESTKFRLGVNSDLAVAGGEDRTFTREHIFAIHNPQLADIITPLFVSGTSVFERSKNAVEKTFELGENPEDIRAAGTLYWEDRVVTGSVNKYCYKKYDQDGQTESDVTRVVPLIRLAEMYLIAMECSDVDKALPFFKELRISRKMNIALDEGFGSRNNLMARVEKEYRKEFFAEGQMFFFCKRLNQEKIMGQTGTMNVSMDENTYVLPKPTGQSVFE